MKILVDGHAFIWHLMRDNRTSKKARSLLSSSEHELFFSLVTLWELSIKIRLGRLRTMTSSIAWLRDELREYGITVLPVTYEDILAVEHLDHIHGDPFDRMIVGQAINRGLTILTKDPFITQYPAPTIW